MESFGGRGDWGLRSALHLLSITEEPGEEDDS